MTMTVISSATQHWKKKQLNNIYEINITHPKNYQSELNAYVKASLELLVAGPVNEAVKPQVWFR